MVVNCHDRPAKLEQHSALQRTTLHPYLGHANYNRSTVHEVVNGHVTQEPSNSNKHEQDGDGLICDSMPKLDALENDKEQIMDDDVIFIKEIRRPSQENIFERFSLGAFTVQKKEELADMFPTVQEEPGEETSKPEKEKKYWPTVNNNNNTLKTPKSKSRKRRTENDSNIKAKKIKDNSSISSSPIARAFFSPSPRIKENNNEKIGACVPLFLKTNNITVATSLQKNQFANCIVDLLDGLAEDAIFQGEYVDAVVTFSSQTVAPPTHVVMHILTKIALAENPLWSRKALLTVQNLMSSHSLNHRNYAPTWDFVVSLATDFLTQIEEQLECLNGEVSSTSDENNKINILSVFTLLVSTFSRDFQRYRNNIRECVIWKILSPSIFGSSRIKIIAEWLTKALIIINDHEFDESEKPSMIHSYTMRLKKFGFVLQRLMNLVYIISRNPEDQADEMAEMYIGCFLDMGSLECRKRLLSSIEPVVVQRKAAAIIISTICESTAGSCPFEDQGISLEKITEFYFKKLPPCKGNIISTSGSKHSAEEIEEFVFLLYILCRSYLQEKHNIAMKNMASLSIVEPTTPTDTTPEFCLPLRDRESLLTLQEEIRNLKIRLESYTTTLSKNTLLYLNMMSALFSFASEGNGLF